MIKEKKKNWNQLESIELLLGRQQIGFVKQSVGKKWIIQIVALELLSKSYSIFVLFTNSRLSETSS